MTVKKTTAVRTRTARKPASGAGQGRAAAKAPRPQPRQELAAELAALQTALAEVLDRVGERLRTRLAGLSAAVTGPGGATLGARRITAMRKAIRAVNVQPAKGRVKDLARLRDLLDVLQEQLASEA
jgi:hypothetical protein